jgi:ABC-type dipeptide/oligopeptide/nickel transport system permease subunit
MSAMTHRDRWNAFRQNRAALVAATLLLCLVVVASVGPPLLFLHNHCDYATQDLANRLQPPTWLHPLGTDTLGRDVLVRNLYGLRVSLLVGLVATLFAVAIGAVYGAVSAYVGGRMDGLMMRLLDII